MKKFCIKYGLIVIITLLLLGSVVYLSWIESQQHSLTTDKDWWTISFVNPLSEQNDFRIENYSSYDTFTYTISSGDEELLTETIIIPHTEQVTITFSEDLPQKNIHIDVYSHDAHKTLYK